MIARGTLAVTDLEALRYGPDEFANLVRRDVEEHGTRIVMIDSVSGYRLSVPGGDLAERLHALGRYLQNIGVTRAARRRAARADQLPRHRGRHQLPGRQRRLPALRRARRSTARPQLRKGIGVLKKRMSDFEKTVREFAITSQRRADRRRSAPELGLRAASRPTRGRRSSTPDARRSARERILVLLANAENRRLLGDGARAALRRGRGAAVAGRRRRGRRGRPVHRRRALAAPPLGAAGRRAARARAGAAADPAAGRPQGRRADDARGVAGRRRRAAAPGRAARAGRARRSRCCARGGSRCGCAGCRRCTRPSAGSPSGCRRRRCRARCRASPGSRWTRTITPGADEARIGGDWYDALRLPDGRVVVTVGDVSGSGLDAAVTMASVRQVLRGVAQVHPDPGADARRGGPHAASRRSRPHRHRLRRACSTPSPRS